MDEQRQDDQLEPIYNSSVLIQDVALKTYQERWTIEMGCERGSGRSMLVVQHDDDNIIFYLYTLSTQQVGQHMRYFFKISFSLSFITISSHKARWFSFSLHIWSATPDFSISPCTTAFWCFSSLTFSGRHILPLYTLPQLHGTEYTQFLVMLYSVGGLSWKRYF